MFRDTKAGGDLDRRYDVCEGGLKGMGYVMFCLRDIQM
jgi:hypothetical protein